jgi:hypothetical protein
MSNAAAPAPQVGPPSRTRVEDWRVANVEHFKLAHSHLGLLIGLMQAEPVDHHAAGVAFQWYRYHSALAQQGMHTYGRILDCRGSA